MGTPPFQSHLWPAAICLCHPIINFTGGQGAKNSPKELGKDLNLLHPVERFRLLTSPANIAFSLTARGTPSFLHPVFPATQSQLLTSHFFPNPDILAFPLRHAQRRCLKVGPKQAPLQKGFGGPGRSSAGSFCPYSHPALYPGASHLLPQQHPPSGVPTGTPGSPRRGGGGVCLTSSPCSAPTAGALGLGQGGAGLPGHRHTWALRQEESPLLRPVRGPQVLVLFLEVPFWYL